MMDKRTLDVAIFEFLRFFSLKNEFLGVGILLVIWAVRFGGGLLMSHAGANAMNIAIELPTQNYLRDGKFANGAFKLIAADRSRHEETKAKVDRGEIGGLLSVDEKNQTYDLYVHGTFAGLDELRSEIVPFHQAWLASGYGLSRNQIDKIFSEPVITIQTSENQDEKRAASLYQFAIGLMVLSLLGIMGGLAVIMQGIAGEKFGKISEMMLTTIPAGVWIDGKLIAATLHGLKIVFMYAIYIVLGLFFLKMMDLSSLENMLHHFDLLMIIVLFSLLGLLFWSILFSGIASIITTTDSSVRSIFILIPITVMIVCMGGIQSPDNFFMVFLSMFPPSAAFSMPVRMIYGGVPIWQILLSLALMVLFIFMLRMFTVKIFFYSIISNGSKTRIGDYVRYLSGRTDTLL